MHVPEDIWATIKSWKRFVCVGHVTPDADCLGSMFALAKVCREQLNLEVSVSLPEGSLSQKLAFMTELGEFPVASGDDFANADGFVAVDTAKKPRCNIAKELGDGWSDGRPVINIDHHDTNTNFGDINWVVGEASSTCELVFELLKAGKLTVDATTASLLYSGIFTDTAGFSLQNATASSFRSAADLVELGADVVDLGERLDRSQRQSEFRLLKTIYANTRWTEDERIAYSTADYDEITSAGCSAADIDDQVQVPRSLNGIHMAILFSEGVKGKARLNFRGEQGIRVLDLAKRFGGGGHAFAAGTILEMSIAEAIETVLPAAQEEIDRQLAAKV